MSDNASANANGSWSFHFIGIMVDQTVPMELLQEEFAGTVVEWKKYGNSWCLYYQGHCNIGSNVDRDKISLNEHELQHFIGVLKRVRSEALYQSYPDDFGLKHVSVGQAPAPVREKPKCRLKLN